MWKTVYLKAACERCSGHIEYPTELAGQSVECPHCHQPTPLAPLPLSPTPAPPPLPPSFTTPSLAPVTPPPPPSPAEIVEQVRSRMNTAFRTDVGNFVATPDS